MSETVSRYSVITKKNPREILMLRGSGCKWKQCTFCDYHLDASSNENANYLLNKEQLEKVTGLYGKLEVINSGSVFELDQQTIDAIIKTCIDKNIQEVHFETHWMYHKKIAALREQFASHNINLKFKIGVESFDESFREQVYKKGMAGVTAETISQYCDEVCLLFGVNGQTSESMLKDIETGLMYFERVCANIMVPNTTKIVPDDQVISIFAKEIAPKYIDNPRVDILFENTDFGVGGIES